MHAFKQTFPYLEIYDIYIECLCTLHLVNVENTVEPFKNYYPLIRITAFSTQVSKLANIT